MRCLQLANQVSGILNHAQKRPNRRSICRELRTGAKLLLTTVHTLGPQLTLVTSKASPYLASMVKTRKNQPVVTALAASHPAVVPVVSALSEETVPEKAPATESCAPSTSDEADVSRPVRVYADGKADELGFNAISRSGRRANTSLIFRHLRSVSFWTRQGIRAGQAIVSLPKVPCECDSCQPATSWTLFCLQVSQHSSDCWMLQ